MPQKCRFPFRGIALYIKKKKRKRSNAIGGRYVYIYMRLVAGKERSEVYAPKEPSKTAALQVSSPPREQPCKSEVVFVDV